jgi:predicted phage terminase large subunit-like protein
MDILDRQAQLDRLIGIGQAPSAPLTMQSESRVDEIYETTRRRAQDSLYFFTTAVLGWNKFEPQPHLEMCNFIQQVPPKWPDKKRRKLLLVPRDCYKSTVASKSFPLWVQIQDDFCGLPGPEHRILLYSFAADNAVKQIRSIKQQVERNENLRWLFPAIIPDITRTKWSDTNLLFPREGMYGEDSIEAAGITTHIVSRHYTIQIGDDSEDKQSSEQPAVREKVKTFYKTAEALFVEEREGYELMVGTRWGVDDLYSEIMTNQHKDTDIMVRPLYWTRQMLEQDFRNAEEEARPPTYNMDPDTFAPDSEKTYYYFPRHFPPDTCQRIEAKQGSFMFSMLYMNDPKDPKNAEFNLNDVLWFTFDQEGHIILDREDGTREVVDMDGLKRVIFWDPANRSEDIRKHSRNAIAVVGKDRKGRIFVLDTFALHKKPELCVTKFIGMHQRWRCHKAAVEDVGFMRLLKFPIYHAMRELGYHFPVQEQSPVGDKDMRIRTLIPFCESRFLCVRRGLTDLREEMKGFPMMPLNDLVDSVAACIELLGNARDVRDTSTSRRDERNERARAATRNTTTGY